MSTLEPNRYSLTWNWEEDLAEITLDPVTGRYCQYLDYETIATELNTHLLLIEAWHIEGEKRQDRIKQLEAELSGQKDENKHLCDELRRWQDGTYRWYCPKLSNPVSA